MSMIVFLVAPALASGTAVWLSGTPDPSAVPSATLLTPEAAAPGAEWTERDQRALDQLKAELAAALPLLDVYDGELQIMRRLESAVSDVRVVRPEDRDLLYRALVFQGLATFRYFPGTIGSDNSAAAYRSEIDGQAEIRAWVDAVALDPDRVPDEATLPDADARFAFQEARARLSLTAPAIVRVASLEPGSSLVVDGKAATTNEARVQPGFHRVAVQADGVWRGTWTRRLDSGETWALVAPATSDELRGVGVELLAVPSQLKLSPAAQARLEALEGPVMLVVTGRNEPEIYDVSGGVASRRVSPENAADDGMSLHGRVVVGGAWVYDGDFYLQHFGEGAPWVKDTVNAGAPSFLAAVELELGPLAVSTGVDLTLPLGEWHDLPVGDGTMRLRAFPHIAVGIPFAQVAVGAWLPWRVGVGPQVHIPLKGPLELTGGYVFGLGIERNRDDGSVFKPDRAQYASFGVGGRFGG
jgi:hypothetical protein